MAVNFAIILVPLVISLLIETRFTQKWAMVGYGVVGFLFSFSFYFDPNTNSPAYNDLKTIAFWIFVPYGLLSVYVAWLYQRHKQREDRKTLLFSGKYFAAVQIPFAWAQYVAIPGTVWTNDIPGVIQWSIISVGLMVILHVIRYLSKNPKRKIPRFA